MAGRTARRADAGAARFNVAIGQRPLHRHAVAATAAALLAVACGADPFDAPTGPRCERAASGAQAAAAPTAPTARVEAGEPEPAPFPAPVWEYTTDEETFSSPRAADLTGDGVLDVVIGLGQDTFGARASAVVAIDGATGAELWRDGGHDDLVGSAAFADLDGDGVPDVVIGGRRGALVAVSGADGERLWRFDDENGRWFNFYSPQPVGDLDGDGVVDLVASNGGLVIDEPREGAGLVPAEEDRVVGRLFVVSGRDGSVIESHVAPDGRESYMSALVVRHGPRVDVLYGTGGETLPGALWVLPLRGGGAPRALVDGGAKGVIAVPSLVDGIGCPFDVVTQTFDGALVASRLDGTVVWRVENPGFETYSSPTLGRFVGADSVPDVFVAMARGVWPDYEFAEHLLVDGATGSVVWRWRAGAFAPSGFAAVDLDGDRRDEVLFGVNDLPANRHRLLVLDPSTPALREVAVLPQTGFSAPWVGDIDADGRLDAIVVASAYHRPGSTIVRRFEVDGAVPGRVAWAGYLGTDGDATWTP